MLNTVSHFHLLHLTPRVHLIPRATGDNCRHSRTAGAHNSCIMRDRMPRPGQTEPRRPTPTQPR
eukprot:7399501-Pyramimonas_sp.AAC.1